MQSDDTFRRAYETTIAQLVTWAEQQRDASRVECENEQNFWRLRLEPLVTAACPVELIIHRPTQRFDIQIGPEGWADIAIERLSIFQPMLVAIVAGRVVTRTWLSTSSGVLLQTDTELALVDGTQWMRSRMSTLGQQLSAAQRVSKVKHWVAYRRG
jgi:hypothetical protein